MLAHAVLSARNVSLYFPVKFLLILPDRIRIFFYMKHFLTAPSPLALSLGLVALSYVLYLDLHRSTSFSMYLSVIYYAPDTVIDEGDKLYKDPAPQGLYILILWTEKLE